MNVNNLLNAGGGTIEVFAGLLGGSGTVSGDLNNSGGTVSPGNSPGVLEITGDFSQAAGGTLLIEISGDQAGVNHDVLSVEGSISLDGQLKVALLDGFVPATGDSFDILDFGSLSGEFDLVSLPPLSAGLAWEVSGLYTDGSLGVVPEPGTALLMLLAMLGLLGGARGRTIAI